MRLIDADALIEQLKEEKENFVNVGYLVGMDTAEEYINNAPTVEPNKWIPCSERLPEEYEDVLISINYIRDNKIKERYTALGSLTPKGWALVRNLYQLLNKFNEVVAWMPFPNPYTESEDKE